MNSSIFIFIFLLTILAIPITMIKTEYVEYKFIFHLSVIFSISWLILAFFYWVSYSKGHKNKLERLKEFAWKFPVFLAVSMGLSMHNAIAVVEGYIGRKTPFIRTPKFNINNKTDQWEGNKYNVKKIGILTYLEGAMVLYILRAIYFGIQYQDYGMLPFLVFIGMGYSIVFFNSIFHWKRAHKKLKYDHQTY